MAPRLLPRRTIQALRRARESAQLRDAAKEQQARLDAMTKKTFVVAGKTTRKAFERHQTAAGKRDKIDIKSLNNAAKLGNARARRIPIVGWLLSKRLERKERKIVQQSGRQLKRVLGTQRALEIQQGKYAVQFDQQLTRAKGVQNLELQRMRMELFKVSQNTEALEQPLQRQLEAIRKQNNTAPARPAMRIGQTHFDQLKRKITVESHGHGVDNAYRLLEIRRSFVKLEDFIKRRRIKDARAEFARINAFNENVPAA